MRLSAVNGIKKSEGGDWKIDLHRNKMIEFRGWSVLVGLRRTARDIATARISSEGLSMRTNARPGKVGARHASKPRTERIACRRLHPLTTLSPNDYLSTHLASLLPRSSSFPHPVPFFRYLSPSLWIAHILPSFFPLLSLFSFTSRRRLTVVPCFLYRLAPVLRAIQPTLYEKTLKSFFATGRASWLLLQPETAATVSSDAIRKLGENASIYACNVYIYTREKIARYSFSAILSNSFVSSFFLHDSVSRSFPLPFSVRPLRRRKEGSELLLGPLPFERESGLVGVHEEVETIATRFPPIKFPATNFSSAKSPRARERELGRNGDRSF